MRPRPTIQSLRSVLVKRAANTSMDVSVKFELVFHGDKPRPAEYHGLCEAIGLVHYVKAEMLDYDGSAMLSIVQVDRGIHS